MQAPADTGSKTLRVVGDHPKLGAWEPKAGLKLRRGEDGVYRGALALPKGSSIAFKMVRGEAWDGVEKTARGGEVTNRVARIDGAVIALKVARWADGAAPRRGPSSACRHVVSLGRMGKASCGADRPVWAHIPAKAKRARLPVLFLLDGQNVFDRATAAFGQEWEADEAYDRLSAAGEVRPHIIVGIGNSPRRMSEYSPDKDPRRGGGDLASLAKLIVDEVIPALKKKAKLDLAGSKTGIAGSSMGGLAAFHLYLRHPERFGRIAAISPSFWWNGNSSAAAVRGRSKLAPPARLWIDIGSREGDGRAPIKNVESVAAALRSKGFKEAGFKVVIEPGGRHNEPSWRARLPRILAFLYPPGS